MEEYGEKDHIQALLLSGAWVRFLYPEIEKRRRELNLILLDPRQNKRQNTSDDFLRGAISALTWVARLPKNRLLQITAQPAVQQDDYPELSPADPGPEDNEPRNN